MIDLDTPQGRFVADMMAAVGKLEKGQIAQRVVQAKTARAKAGRHPGGRRPYGYRLADGLLVPDPIEAAVVRRMFELAEAGTSQRQISHTLNAENITTARGGRWAPSTVNRILRARCTSAGCHARRAPSRASTTPSWTLTGGTA